VATPEPKPKPKPATTGNGVNFALQEENGSGRSGTATLKRGRKRFTVVLALDDESGSYHAHIHDVTCTRYRGMKGFDARLGTVVQTLNTVLAGTSRTAVTVPLRKYTNGGSSINVHLYEPPFDVVACGDVPKSR
jgi:hypothetical protein